MPEMIHSKYGGSGASIYLACNASVEMSEGMPFYTVDYDDLEDDRPAALGNAAHDLSEFCFALGVNTYDCIGFTFNRCKQFPEGFKVDENMAEATQLYVGYVRSLSAQLNSKPMIERKVFMTSVRSDVFGTSDCFFIVGNTLYIVDYKHGFVTVEIANNKQIIFYAIAALDTYGLWGQIEHIKTTIVQPRADHIDGPIRSFDYTKAELMQWQQTFKNAILTPNTVPQPGRHCKYCPASGHCRPRIMRTLQLCYHDKPGHTMTVEETETIFNEIDVIKKNLEKIEKRMLNHARRGNNIKGWKLVSANKHYVCNDEQGLVKAAVASGIEQASLYAKKLQSKSKLEKILDRNVIDKFFFKPNAASTLVRLSDSRPALAHNKSINGVFEKIE